jgi:hypothetical protein
MKMYLCPKRSFVKPVVKEFLAKWNSRRELIFNFDLGGRILPPKLLGFERGMTWVVATF